MIDFIVLGLPRSGTTWLANWLTTDKSLCLHDPLSHYTPEQLESYRTGRPYFGVSCTGLWMFNDWLSRQVTPVIIERDVDEVNESLAAIGLPSVTPDMLAMFRDAKGIRLPFESLWTEDGAEAIWRCLLPSIPFDSERYALLSEFEMQPNFQKWKPNLTLMRDLFVRGRGESCRG